MLNTLKKYGKLMNNLKSIKHKRKFNKNHKKFILKRGCKIKLSQKIKIVQKEMTKIV